MKKMNKIGLFALILVVFTILPGCVGQEEEPPETTTPTTTPTTKEVKNPDTIITTVYGPVEELDPHICYDGGCVQLMNGYEFLVFFDKEKIDQFVPQLATKVPTLENGLISPDGMTYTFPIREGVKFWNGNPMTPEDVEYSFERALVVEPDGGPIWMLCKPLLDLYSTRDADTGEIIVTAEDIDNAVEVDGNNVVFHLAIPYPPFIQIMSLQYAAILDKEWMIEQGCWPGTWDNWQEYNNIDTSPITHKMMGTGPYQLEAPYIVEDPDVECIMVRNEQYWGELPPVKTIHWKFIDEWSTVKMMFLQGDLDIIHVDPAHLAELEGAEGVEMIGPLAAPDIGVMLFNFNISPDSEFIGSGKLDGEGIPTDFFTDRFVRLGFAYSFSAADWIDQAWVGQGIELAAPIPEGIPFYNPDQEKFSLDLAKAEEYFKQAWNGEVWEKGFKLTVPYDMEWLAEETLTQLQMLDENLKKINPKFHLEPLGMEESAFWDLVEGSDPSPMPIDPQAYWWPDFPDADNFFETYMGSYGYYTWNMYCGTPHIDELIARGASTLDPEERQEVYYELQQIFHDDAYGIPLLQLKQYWVQRDWIQGFYFRPIWYDAFPYRHLDKGY